jgi:hypothetical protein
MKGQNISLCKRTVLNCTAQARKSKPIFLDPFLPLSAGTVSCLPNSPAEMVVFSGPGCYLWDWNNDLRCFWNASSQVRRRHGCAHAVAALAEAYDRSLLYYGAHAHSESPFRISRCLSRSSWAPAVSTPTSSTAPAGGLEPFGPFTARAGGRGSLYRPCRAYTTSQLTSRPPHGAIHSHLSPFTPPVVRRRHLTDFKGGSQVKLQTASLSQMLALNPGAHHLIFAL